MNNSSNVVSQLDWLLNTEPMDLWSNTGNTGKAMWHGDTKPTDTTRSNVVDPIKCADGTTLSVQASAQDYCSPRENTTGYEQVEVGFPSAPVPEWASYKDGEGDDTRSVFGWVPVELVRAFIAAHGGESIN